MPSTDNVCIDYTTAPDRMCKRISKVSATERRKKQNILKERVYMCVSGRNVH